MTDRIGDWCQSSTGRAIWPLDPRVDEICIEDIALSLARTNRFNGHLKPGVWSYSTAQHSVIVSHACLPEHARIGLLHDAPEFAVQDLTRPLKRSLAMRTDVYELAEQQWALAIGERFGLGDALAELPADVKRADEAVLATEQRDLMAPCARDWRLRESPLPERIVPWDAYTAYRLFMARFEELFPEFVEPVRIGAEDVP
jgi:5'-deoxynucleotidase YfbR-like HD superfamily hydrolase